jgi:hypothetical protein
MLGAATLVAHAFACLPARRIQLMELLVRPAHLPQAKFT